MIKLKITFKPTEIPNALCREKETSTVTISIDSKYPHAKNKTTFDGQYATSIARWLRSAYGMRGHLVGEFASPQDAVAALSLAKWLKFEIISANQQEPLAYRFGGDERNASEARIPSAHNPTSKALGRWADG